MLTSATLSGASVGAFALALFWAYLTQHPSTRRALATLLCLSFVSAFAWLAQYFKMFDFWRYDDVSEEDDPKQIFPALAWLSTGVVYFATYLTFDFLLVEARSMKMATKWITVGTALTWGLNFYQRDDERHALLMCVGAVWCAGWALFALINAARRDIYGLAAMLCIFVFWASYPMTFIFGHAWLDMITLVNEHVWLLVNTFALFVYCFAICYFIVADSAYLAQNPGNVDGLGARSMNIVPNVWSAAHHLPPTRIGDDQQQQQPQYTSMQHTQTTF